ncbi:GNAT family N-acetyltransferase [Arthrobacter sp. 260]|uniref:GNAT family N-acetyltransferase n=1 Tax=Arthrobacter sp. 260 TaxID=2735314 RepID=UPI001491F49C|nr:GNAT family N-acetyltransferase [Arthrobacter sp. 260]NOJ58981.1 GNAT family N-acetyltransferase [Arthrobacter sp. 260]
MLEAICDARVLGAFIGSDLAGYVLFDLPYSDVRLVHLCVRSDLQGTGTARKLIDEIQTRHGDRQGIRLKCRRDYAAHKVWPKLGFQAESLPTGRGRDQAEMTAWWRGFGHADLFAAAREDDLRIQAVLDTNVVLDLTLGRDLLTQQYFEAPSLSEEVIYCVTRSVKNELSETPNLAERRIVMAGISKYESLTGDLAISDQLVEELLDGIDPVEILRDRSLPSDARVLAETIVAGASVMITNDDNAGRILRPRAELHGVDILHPSQLVVKIEELKGVRRDAPDRIQNTSITIRRALAGADREHNHLITSHRGETRAAFAKHLRSQTNANVRTVHSADSTLADALVATTRSGDALEVPILRVRRSPLGPTLLKQILFQLRQEALQSGALRAVITDPEPGGGEIAEPIFGEDGFRSLDGRWSVEVVDAQLKQTDIHAGNHAPWDLRPWIRQGEATGKEIARLEHELWPLKVIDAPLPCYVVPIRQRYASELLGYDTPLLARSDGLGIGRRHVYYKSANLFPTAPGRILWYVSGKAGGAIVAASQLVSSHKGSAQSLHTRFQKYGVWTYQDIEERAGKTGYAVALRFGDTEILRHSVKLSEASRIVEHYGRILGTVPTVRRIDGEAFQEIYAMGMKR